MSFNAGGKEGPRRKGVYRRKGYRKGDVGGDLGAAWGENKPCKSLLEPRENNPRKRIMLGEKKVVVSGKGTLIPRIEGGGDPRPVEKVPACVGKKRGSQTNRGNLGKHLSTKDPGSQERVLGGNRKGKA